MSGNLESKKCWHSSRFTADPRNGFEHYRTGPHCLPPSHEMVKEFMRWYVSSTEGRLSDDKKPTLRTAKAYAERFFGGFTEYTKTEVAKEDQKEIYNVGFLSQISETSPCWTYLVDNKYVDEGRKGREQEKAKVQLHQGWLLASCIFDVAGWSSNLHSRTDENYHSVRSSVISFH